MNFARGLSAEVESVAASSGKKSRFRWWKECGACCSRERSGPETVNEATQPPYGSVGIVNQGKRGEAFLRKTAKALIKEDPGFTTILGDSARTRT